MLYFCFVVILSVVLAVLLWPARHDKLFCKIIVGAGFIAVFALYGFLGSSQILSLLAARDARIAELSDSMQKNSELVKTDPKNLNAWVELGQAFLETGQWEAAENALKQAVLLSGGDPVLILAYAKSIMLVAGGTVTDEAKKSLRMVLLQEPKNEEAQYYLALRQLQDGNTKEAMKAMKELYHSLSADSPLKAMIDKQIGKDN